jgi:hypothetical protein
MPIWTALRERSLETVTSRNDNTLVDLSLDGSFGASASSLRDVVARIAHDQVVVAIKALMEALPDVLSARVAKLAQEVGLELSAAPPTAETEGRTSYESETRPDQLDRQTSAPVDDAGDVSSRGFDITGSTVDDQGESGRPGSDVQAAFAPIDADELLDRQFVNSVEDQWILAGDDDAFDFAFHLSAAVDEGGLTPDTGDTLDAADADRSDDTSTTGDTLDAADADRSDDTSTTGDTLDAADADRNEDTGAGPEDQPCDPVAVGQGTHAPAEQHCPAGSAVGVEPFADAPPTPAKASIGSSGPLIVPDLPQDSIAILAANVASVGPSPGLVLLQSPEPANTADAALNVRSAPDALGGLPAPVADLLNPSVSDVPSALNAPSALEPVAGLSGSIPDALTQLALETGLNLTPDPVFHFAAVPADFTGTAGKTDYFIYDADAINDFTTITGFETGVDELILMNFDPQADTITLDFALGQDAASKNSALVNGGGVTLVNASLDQETDVVTTPDPMLVL